jgi:ADP-ribose pyrophosphatase YjhB (NUDIX family)
MSATLTTLGFLLSEAGVCLGMKKRGFGAGKWNGYGGKVEPGETIRDSLAREIFEEAGGVRVDPGDLEQVALLHFYFKNDAIAPIEMHAFFARHWIGEPAESEEMSPQWFAFGAIPFASMWKDDPHWLPRALAGERLAGEIRFDETGDAIEHMEWKPAAFAGGSEAAGG